MGRIIMRDVVDIQPGMLYYVDGKGNVCEAEMHRKGRTTKKKKAKKKTAKKK